MGGPGSGRRKKDAALNAAASATVGQKMPYTLSEGPTQPLSDYFAESLKKGLSKALIGDKNPMWNDDEEIALSKAISFSTSPISGSYIGINERFSKRYPVADLNIPRNPDAVVQLSLRYAMENPFVAKALRVKSDFTCKDFKHKTHNESAKKFFDNLARQLQLRSQLPRICWNLFAVGICPIYWGGEEGGPIQFMQILNPAAVHIENILGKNKMWLKITRAMADAVRDPNGKEDPKNKAQYDAMPQYWIDQIKAALKANKTSGLIELMEGSYTVVDYRYVPYNRAENTLDGVPLQAAFDALQRYRLLAAGDFAVAWNVKNMLTLISEGDPNADPKDYKPADNIRLDKLRQQFAHPDYALTIFCDPTTSVRYVVPPLEVFDPKKYSQVEKEIKEVLNLPSFMWNNDGKGTFGAAQAEVQLLRQEVQAVRMLLEDQLFYPLYTRARLGAKRAGFAASDIPMPEFDQNSLRDDAIWLQQNQGLYAAGALSLETLMEVFGYNFEYEIKQKEEEHDKYGGDNEPLNNTTARPLFEPGGNNNAKDPNGDKGGRPSPEGNTEHGTRAPRKNGK